MISPPESTRVPLKTVHLIFNAHIDPVWLWPWIAGLDEVLNTCESVCDFLDCHPEVFFTRGEAWVYEQIEKIAPRLFNRVHRHVRAGRWEVVGGWYIQPDCNLPGKFGLEKQIELGRAYFSKKFGAFSNVGYNVDSFGHASVLPEVMATAGQKYYVLMRPNELEMPSNPARLFRWRGHPGGSEIVTFRIAAAYNTSMAHNLEQHVQKSLTQLLPGVHHTMCFMGLGDHGGGPNERTLRWCLDHRDAFPGVQLEFSSPSRFFRAVTREKARLPLVTGELQYHAVGCYSVYRPVKVRAHRAEHLLAQAGNALRFMGAPGVASARRKLEDAWRWVCFNQFHDTLGGTCIPSAYEITDAQLGAAEATADEVAQHGLRRYVRKLPPDPFQRVVVANFSDAVFDDWIEHEPWLDRSHWTPEADWRLVDEKRQPLAHQFMMPECVHGSSRRLVFKLRIEKGEFRVLRVARYPAKRKPDPMVPLMVRTRPSDGPDLVVGRHSWPAPQLELIEDPTDTWSHVVSSYEGRCIGKVTWQSLRLADSGSLLRAWRVDGTVRQSSVAAEWRGYAGEPLLELRLKVVWLETQRLLRLAWEPGGDILSREDGVPGGGLRRASDGQERPVRERTLFHLKNGAKAGVVMPEVLSLSSSERELRLTLLRSPVMAHHEPHSGLQERRAVSDQGTHEFCFASSRLVGMDRSLTSTRKAYAAGPPSRAKPVECLFAFSVVRRNPSHG